MNAFRTHLEEYKYDSPSPSPLKTPSSQKRSRGAEIDEIDHSVSHVDDVDDVLPVLTQNTSRKSRKKPRRLYAPPETYEHLHMLPDYLEHGLDGALCVVS